MTVLRDGMEVSISSHEAEAKAIKREMQNGKILHLSEKLPLGSEWYLTEAPRGAEGPDLVPTSGSVFGGKGSEKKGEKQGGGVAGVTLLEDREKYSVELRRAADGTESFAIRLKKGASLNEWRVAVEDYGRYSSDGRGELLFDSYGAMTAFLKSQGERTGSLDKRTAEDRDRQIDESVYRQTGLRAGQVWTGPDGTRVAIVARGFVKGPRGWDFRTTVTYPDGRTESTLTPASRIAEFFGDKGYRMSEKAEAPHGAEAPAPEQKAGDAEGQSRLRTGVFAPAAKAPALSSRRSYTMREFAAIFREYAAKGRDGMSAPEIDRLAMRVFAVAERLGLELKFYTDSRHPWTAGSYANDNTIRLNLATVKGTKGLHLAETMLHEAIHSVTSYALRLHKQGRIPDGSLKDACQELCDVYDVVRRSGNFRQWDRRSRRGDYGTLSVMEMVAELANPEFRAKMKATGVWRRVVKAIARIVGVETKDSKRSDALAETEAALGKMLDNFSAEAYKEYVTNEGKKRFESARKTVAEEEPLRRFAESREDFEGLRDRAIAERGIVMPGLRNKTVRVTEVTPLEWKGGFGATKKSAKGILEELRAEQDKKPLTVVDSAGRVITVKLTRDGVGEILNGKSYEAGTSHHGHEREDQKAYFAIINNLHEVLRNSVECEIHPDVLKNGQEGRDGSRINSDGIVHQFYGAVHCDGFPALSRVRFMIKENRTNTGKGNLYTFELTKIELLDESNSSIYGTEGLHAKGIDTRLQGAKVLQGVEKSYDKGKFLLDESDNSTFGRTLATKRPAARMERGAVEARTLEVSRRSGVAVELDSAIEGKGEFDARTGKVKINPDKVEDAADLERTIAHEMTGHGGVLALLGERFDGVCHAAAELIPGQMRERLKAAYPKASEAELGAEWIARLAERPQAHPTMWQRIVGRVRLELARRGFTSLTEADIRYMLYRAGRMEARGELGEKIGRAMERRNAAIERELRDAAKRSIREVEIHGPLKRVPTPEEIRFASQGMKDFGLIEGSPEAERMMETIHKATVQGEKLGLNSRNAADVASRSPFLRRGRLDADSVEDANLQQFFELAGSRLSGGGARDYDAGASRQDCEGD